MDRWDKIYPNENTPRVECLGLDLITERRGGKIMQYIKRVYSPRVRGVRAGNSRVLYFKGQKGVRTSTKFLGVSIFN